MMKYDVVIIGAGPAGSYLAYKLKNQGINVLLLEKKIFPRYKVCAGGLSKKTYDILYSENKKIKSIVEKAVKKGLYVRNNKFIFIDAEIELVFMTYRSYLDNFLVNMAVDKKTISFKDNINIKKINRNNNSITFLHNSKEFKVNYKILVGAWGSNIRFNKLIDLNPFERFDLSSSWEGPAGPVFNKYSKDYILTQIMKKYPNFTFYIFPKSELITAGLFTSKYPFSKVWNDAWNDFMDFWKLDKSIKPRYAVIPIRNLKKPIAMDNILLIGDAAGIADPFVGEGLYNALICSSIAAKHIINFFKIDNYDIAYNYNENINRKLYDVLKWARAYVFIYNLFPNFSFWFGSETSIGKEILISLITGDIKYNEVKKILKCFIRKMKFT
ncbi:hypothetical protein AYK20_00895 [Thermoplasmatales archaeon SG8-52-1]|nr:MAG: hypothetical protein AYK20_00895 [Thermoplasmatales archaeon SG8-52-1]